MIDPRGLTPGLVLRLRRSYSQQRFTIYDEPRCILKWINFIVVFIIVVEDRVQIVEGSCRPRIVVTVHD